MNDNKKMENKIAVLAEKMKNEQSLSAGRLNTESLQKAWQDGRAVFIFDKGREKIISAGVLWLRESTAEIGSLWTHPEHRGNGLTAEVFNGLVARTPKNITLFVVASNRRIADIALGCGMQEAERKDWIIIAGCPKSCNQCDRLPVADRAHCSLRFFKKGYRLFFSQPVEGRYGNEKA